MGGVKPIWELQVATGVLTLQVKKEDGSVFHTRKVRERVAERMDFFRWQYTHPTPRLLFFVPLNEGETIPNHVIFPQDFL